MDVGWPFSTPWTKLMVGSAWEPISVNAFPSFVSSPLKLIVGATPPSSLYSMPKISILVLVSWKLDAYI